MDTPSPEQAYPHGPIRVPQNRQIALPKELTDRIGLLADAAVYVSLSEEVPGALLVTPATLLFPKKRRKVRR
jgi:hypothetical protein